MTKIHRYRIAGMEVVSNLESNLPAEGFADHQVQVRFVDKLVTKKNSYLSPEWLQVPASIPSQIMLHDKGAEAIVLQDGLNKESCAIAIRQLLPFSSALQREVILHASAISINNQVVCFIAESGSGKSTFAEILTKYGFPHISDDLLPCRIDNGEIRVPILLENSVSLLKISMIFFLSREKKLNSLKLNYITEKECLTMLLHNGFGEMKNKAIWKHQFEIYGHLARTVKSIKLILPDNLLLLDKTANEFISTFEKIIGNNI